MRRRICTKTVLMLATIMLLTLPADAAEVSKQLPDPDGKPADMTKKVKVFIIMGQSNTLEMGKVAGDKEGSLEYDARLSTG
jgi:hypothetical protein